MLFSYLDSLWFIKLVSELESTFTDLVHMKKFFCVLKMVIIYYAKDVNALELLIIIWV